MLVNTGDDSCGVAQRPADDHQRGVLGGISVQYALEGSVFVSGRHDTVAA